MNATSGLRCSISGCHCTAITLTALFSKPSTTPSGAVAEAIKSGATSLINWWWKELTQAIKEYIEYYNEERIKSRLKGLTAKEYRNQASINPVF